MDFPFLPLFFVFKLKSLDILMLEKPKTSENR